MPGHKTSLGHNHLQLDGSKEQMYDGIDKR